MDISYQTRKVIVDIFYFQDWQKVLQIVCAIHTDISYQGLYPTEQDECRRTRGEVTMSLRPTYLTFPFNMRNIYDESWKFL